MNEEKFSILSQLYIQLRRHGGRVIDVTWAMANAEYLREVLKVSYGAGDPMIDKLAQRLHELSVGPTKIRAPAMEPVIESDPTPNQYVGKLR